MGERPTGHRQSQLTREPGFNQNFQVGPIGKPRTISVHKSPYVHIKTLARRSGARETLLGQNGGGPSIEIHNGRRRLGGGGGGELLDAMREIRKRG